MTTKKGLKVVAYCRVSTQRQAEEGISLDAQRERLTAFAKATDLEIVGFRIDAGISAKSLRRPGIQAALEDLRTGKAEAILVCKLDRLTRRLRDLTALVDEYFAKRFSLISITDSIDTRSAGGRLVLNVLGTVAEWERDQASERATEAAEHLRNLGVVVGGEALGWRRSEERDEEGRLRLVADPAEVATARRIHDLRTQGLSLRKICRVLCEEGRETKCGGRWGPETVSRVLRRPPLPASLAEVQPAQETA
jgi:site-specific DNA recombinase